jgi:K+-sensing histidine kinase KdpD
LAICKNIIDAHDGEVQASKSELGGLCIEISLLADDHSSKNSG